MKTSIFLLTFVVVGLNAHDPASADHKFTCAPHDQNGARLPYDGPFICGQIYVFRADCEHLRKTRGRSGAQQWALLQFYVRRSESCEKHFG